jgi:hypothetical protein
MDRFFDRPPERFGLALLTILAAVIVQLAVPDTDLTRTITIALQAAVVVVALFASGARLKAVRIAAGLAILMSAGSAVVLLSGEEVVGPEVPRLVSLALVAIAPVAIGIGLVRELRQDGEVRFQTIFAGLCLYLLLGLGGSFLFASIEDVSGDPFFVEISSGTPNDFLYYSFATLTTTGYGDLSAATSIARAASITIALLGQIYLVTVIAVLVGNLGRQRLDRAGPRGGGSGSSDAV